MKKRQLFAILGAMILALSTAACGSSGTAPATETEKTDQAQENTESAAQAQQTDTEKAAQAQEDPESAAQAQQADTEKAAQTQQEGDGSAAAGSTASAESADFAPEDSTLSEDGSVIEFPAVGVTFTLPESFKDTKGFLPNGGGEINPGDGVYCMYYNYIALDEDDYEDLLVKYRTNSENAEKYENFFNPRVLGMFSIYAADGNRSAEDINEYLKKLNEARGNTSARENPMEGAQLIGTVGEYNFYFLDQTQADVEIPEDDSVPGAAYDLTGFNEEYRKLIEDVKNACPDLMTFSEPE